MTAMQFDKPLIKAREDAAWTVARRCQQFGYGEIASDAHMSVKLATSFVQGWIKAGRVRAINSRSGGSGRLLFEVIPEAEITVPVIGDAYEQMWTAMRKFPSFTPADLRAFCSVPVDEAEVQSYCQALLAAKYLKVLIKARPGIQRATYRLVEATGIKAPRLKRMRCLIDVNIDKIIPMAEVRHG